VWLARRRRLYRPRRSPIIGRGDAIWACLHLDDAVDAFLAAAVAGRAGLWHIVDDHSVTAADFLRYFAERLGAPPPLRVPARLAAGSYAVDFFTRSTRTPNARFCRDFPRTPRYPSHGEGIEKLVMNSRSK